MELLRNGNEDLNLPYILLGMQVEKSLHYGMDKDDEWEGIGTSKGIKHLYSDRIASILNPARHGSLVASTTNLEAAIVENKKALLEELQNANIEYTTTKRSVNGPCMSVSLYYVGEETSRIAQRAKGPLSELASRHELALVMQLHDTYKLMVERAKYALAILTEKGKGNYVEPREPIDFVRSSALVPEIRNIIDQSLQAHMPKIERKKEEWRKHNRDLRFLLERDIRDFNKTGICA